MKDGLKIIGLKLEGIRKIRAGELAIAETGLTTISGKNKQGKTTILDSILALFGGAREEKEDLVTKGRDRGRIEAVVKGGDGVEYRIEKVVKADGGSSTLKVTDAKGIRIEKPQGFLDGLFAGVAMNPRPFLSLGAAEKMKYLLDLFRIDTAAEDKEIKRTEEERTILGREIKGLVVEAVEKVARVNIDEEIEKKKEIRAEIAKCSAAKQNELAALSKKASDAKEKRENHRIRTLQAGQDKDRVAKRIAYLEEELRVQRIEAAKIDATIERLQEEEEFLPDAIEVPVYRGDSVEFPAFFEVIDEIDGRIGEASRTNERATAYENSIRKAEQRRKKEDEFAALSDRLKTLRSTRIEKVKDAVGQVSGLEAVLAGDDDRPAGLYKNGIHSDSWSDSESLAIALDLARAANPRLRAVLLDRGESFDRDSLSALEKWAVENDMQAIVAIVASDPDEAEEGGYFIEEGEITKH